MASPALTTPFRRFACAEWALLRGDTPLPLSERELGELRGVHDRSSIQDVADIYLPLSRFLSLHVNAARGLQAAQNEFLGAGESCSPFLIAVSGSVAVGKSTFARVLQALVARWPSNPSVALVATDGFLYPNAVLEGKGLMRRKGYPESYDLRRMLRFLSQLKAGKDEVEAPVYSHLLYDIVPRQKQLLKRPDLLIFEGLNVLQSPHGAAVLASDFFDFSIYLDADEADLERWYIDRFLLLQRSSFQDPGSYFYRYRDLAREEAEAVALEIWRRINLPNLQENIAPTRQRADLILRKASDHRIESVLLRQL